MTFKKGQRVLLLANAEEGWPEEVGTVLGADGNDSYLIELDLEFIDYLDDDGIRSVTTDQMRLIP